MVLTTLVILRFMMGRLSVALSFRPYGISFLQQELYLDAELKDV